MSALCGIRSPELQKGDHPAKKCCVFTANPELGAELGALKTTKGVFVAKGGQCSPGCGSELWG